MGMSEFNCYLGRLRRREWRRLMQADLAGKSGS